MVLLFVIITLFVLYSLLVVYYWLAWKTVSIFIPAISDGLKISVIIPARNEEKNIGALLSSLQKQTYPKEFFEIIVVDDHSTDNTAAVVKQYDGVKLLQLKEEGINSYKKKALETGIAASTGDWIVTTDADCIVQSEWLQTIVSYQQKTNAVLIAAPVDLNCNHALLQIFQATDFMILQAITGASIYKKTHSMGNGANLAYVKKVFNEVSGFTGIDHIASGDDMLLMHKISKQYPDKVHYLKSKEAIVSTEPMKTWKAFFNQRIRWASKANKYDDKKITVVLLFVYLFNLSFLALLIAGFFCHHYWLWLGVLWIAKTIVEWPLVYSAAVFFNKQTLLKYFFFLQPMHILYTITAGFLGLFGKYEWKGRKVK